MTAIRLGALALALAALTAGPLAASPRSISIVANGRLSSGEAMRKDFMARTDHRISVDLRVGPTFGSEGEILNAVRAGSVDIALLTGAFISPVVPRYGVFDVPFLFRDAAHVRAVIDGPVEKRIAEAFPAEGLVLLGIGDQGFREMTNSKRPIREPADLRGLRMRVIPNELFTMTFKTLGADVVPLDFTLLHGALLDGRVDGQENPPSSIVSAGFQDSQRFMTMTDHVYGTIGIVMNKETYDSLDPADRDALIQSVIPAETDMRAVAERDNDAGLAALRKTNMQIVDHADRAAFLTALAPLEPEFDRRFGHDLLTQIRDTK
jgi:tripartite ATP-independent transporter DctP family solute receptor